MATASAPGPNCPICHDGFNTPKIMPCAHSVCRKCLISWLEKEGEKNGCPLCRVPILAAPSKGQEDRAQQVDDMPTDLASAMVVDSQKTLTEPHICICSKEADFFCLQCNIDLCTDCSKTHVKIPACRSHTTEQLSNLTAEQLAMQRQMFCDNHTDKPTELFCCGHEELICVFCVSSTHRQCSELKGIGDVAPVKREEVRSLATKLADREAAVTAKIKKLDAELVDAQAKFKAMRDEVQAAFDELQGCLEAKRQKLNAEIQAREDSYLAELKSCKLDMENVQAAVAAHRQTAEQLVASAPDVALLGMLKKLRKRLDTLQCGKLPDHPKSTPGRLTLKSATVGKAKEALAAVGVLESKKPEEEDCPWLPVADEEPTPHYKAQHQCDEQKKKKKKKRSRKGDHGGETSQAEAAEPKDDTSGDRRDRPLPMRQVTAAAGRPAQRHTHLLRGDRDRPLEGPEFASVIKVGDRVQRGRDWCYGSQDGPAPGLGTVTRVADLTQGLVCVQWDHGGSEGCYCMGWGNMYHLKLATGQ